MRLPDLLSYGFTHAYSNLIFSLSAGILGWFTRGGECERGRNRKLHRSRKRVHYSPGVPAYLAPFFREAAFLC